MSTTPQTATDAADFYLGRGGDAKYLGTRSDDGAPENIEVWERFQSLDDQPVTDDAYVAEVGELINHPVWPWTHHRDSADTPWCYMFDRGTLYVYRYGVEMARIVANYTVPLPRSQGGRQPRAANLTQVPTAPATVR